MDLYIREIKAEPKANGVEEIFIPGEIEYHRVNERKTNGIKLPLAVAEELAQIGKRYNIDLEQAAFIENVNQGLKEAHN